MAKEIILGIDLGTTNSVVIFKVMELLKLFQTQKEQ